MQKFNPADIGRTNHAQGYYVPQNPSKYVGQSVNHIVYRSSWEKDFIHTCDLNPAIVNWAIEPFSIPYIDPISGAKKNYWPDFLVCYMKRDGTIHRELIEIKPQKESIVEKAKSKRDKINLIVNQAKWAAADRFCKANGLTFRILTEAQLYGKK